MRHRGRQASGNVAQQIRSILRPIRGNGAGYDFIGHLFVYIIAEERAESSTESFIRACRNLLMLGAQAVYNGRVEKFLEDHPLTLDENPFPEGSMEHLVIELARRGEQEYIGRTLETGAEAYQNSWSSYKHRRQKKFPPGAEYGAFYEAFTGQPPPQP